MNLFDFSDSGPYMIFSSYIFMVIAIILQRKKKTWATIFVSGIGFLVAVVDALLILTALNFNPHFSIYYVESISETIYFSFLILFLMSQAVVAAATATIFIVAFAADRN